MVNYKLNAARLDKILKKTIEAIYVSKNEIYDIAESSRKECNKLQEELDDLKKKVAILIQSVEVIEAELKESKRRLLIVNKNFNKYSQEEFREAYEKADNLRVELAVKREQEQHLIRRRNELEIRLNDAYRTIKRAENLYSNVDLALSYLEGDLQNMVSHVGDLQEKQFIGFRIIKAQEDERKRVAREIHDGPAQSMSNVVLKAELCERMIDVDVAKSKEELQELKRVVRECIQDTRKIIYNLRPMSLDDLGLVPTIQRFITTFQDETEIVASFKATGDYNDIKPIISLTVFRIVQEAINNIKKHSCAKNAIVNIEFVKNNIRIYIYDDGKGFDINELKVMDFDSNGGFGLISMRERVELLGGEFNISSEPGKGTRLNIMIPLI